MLSILLVALIASCYASKKVDRARPKVSRTPCYKAKLLPKSRKVFLKKPAVQYECHAYCYAHDLFHFALDKSGSCYCLTEYSKAKLMRKSVVCLRKDAVKVVPVAAAKVKKAKRAIRKLIRRKFKADVSELQHCTHLKHRALRLAKLAKKVINRPGTYAKDMHRQFARCVRESTLYKVVRKDRRRECGPLYCRSLKTLKRYRQEKSRRIKQRLHRKYMSLYRTYLQCRRDRNRIYVPTSLTPRSQSDRKNSRRVNRNKCKRLKKIARDTLVRWKAEKKSLRKRRCLCGKYLRRLRRYQRCKSRLLIEKKLKLLAGIHSRSRRRKTKRKLSKVHMRLQMHLWLQHGSTVLRAHMKHRHRKAKTCRHVKQSVFDFVRLWAGSDGAQRKTLTDGVLSFYSGRSKRCRCRFVLHVHKLLQMHSRKPYVQSTRSILAVLRREDEKCMNAASNGAVVDTTAQSQPAEFVRETHQDNVIECVLFLMLMCVAAVSCANCYQCYLRRRRSAAVRARTSRLVDAKRPIVVVSSTSTHGEDAVKCRKKM